MFLFFIEHIIELYIYMNLPKITDFNDSDKNTLCLCVTLYETFD